jgi:2-oxoglutarate ferredoxin oxidoreductase subunit beta
MASLFDYAADAKPIWCSFCGNYPVLSSFLQALANREIPPDRLALVSGIGCAGRFPAFVKCYGLHAVHGRALPIATGLQAARPDLTVVALGGDGDGLGIGGGHFLNAGRRNPDLTYLFFDNSIYGMTKGQPSPTTPLGTLSRSTPRGNPDAPLNPVQLAIVAGYTFVGRGYAGASDELIPLLTAALAHRGLSFVQILTPCVTHNRHETYDYYRDRVRPLEAGGRTDDACAAIALAASEAPLHLGLFYRTEAPTYADRLATAAADGQPAQPRPDWRAALARYR